MRENEWKSIVIEDAESKGICAQYSELLRRAKSLSDFLNLYRRGVDWSLENDCPSIALLRRYKEERLDLHGIFVDKHFEGEVLIDRQVYIFHNCTGTIKTGLNVDKKIIPMLYFANGCDMRVEGEGHVVSVPLYVFGENKIDVDTDSIKPVIYDKRKN